MYGPGTAPTRGSDNRVNIEIALGCHRRTDVYRVVSKLHSKTIFIGIAKHGDSAHAELFRRADDADGNLTAISD